MFRKIVDGLASNLDISIAFVVLIITIVIDITGEPPQQYIVAIGCAVVIALLASHIRTRFLHQEVISKVNGLSRPDIKGILDVTSDFTNDYNKSMDDAEDRIWMLQTWCPTVFEHRSRNIQNAINRDVTVRILILDIDAPKAIEIIKRRVISIYPEKDENSAVKWGVEEITRSLEYIKKMAEENPDIKIHVRFHTVMPSAPAYWCDDVLYVGHFYARIRAVSMPFIKIIGSENEIKNSLEDEFVQLWNNNNTQKKLKLHGKDWDLPIGDNISVKKRKIPSGK